MDAGIRQDDRSQHAAWILGSFDCCHRWSSKPTITGRDCPHWRWGSIHTVPPWGGTWKRSGSRGACSRQMGPKMQMLECAFDRRRGYRDSPTRGLAIRSPGRRHPSPQTWLSHSESRPANPGNGTITSVYWQGPTSQLRLIWCLWPTVIKLPRPSQGGEAYTAWPAYASNACRIVMCNPALTSYQCESHHNPAVHSSGHPAYAEKLAAEPSRGSSRHPSRRRWYHASTRCRYMDVGASNCT